MAYSATINKSWIVNDNLAVEVKYSNGVDASFSLQYFPSSTDELGQTITNCLNKLNTLSDLASSISVGIFTPPVPQPESPQISPQPQDGIKDPQIDFSSAVEKLQRWKALVDSGVIQSNDPGYLKALDAAKSLYSPDLV